MRAAAFRAPKKITEQMWDNNSPPLVSIFNWVYNHEGFIRESIESILMQETTFPVEIIIHDDASSDNTQTIIMEYEKLYPKLFQNILHKENQWSQGKSVMTPLLTHTRGKYIALTHGDDYWTDPLKLQNQIDFLEQNPSYSACFTNSIYVDRNGTQTGICERVPEGIVDIIFEDLAQTMYMHTPSMVLRMEHVQTFLNKEHSQYSVGDLPLFLTAALVGPIRYIPINATAYRMNVGIMSTWGHLQGLKNKIQVLRLFYKNNTLNSSQKKAHFQSLTVLYLKLAKHQARSKKFSFIVNYFQFVKYSLYLKPDNTQSHYSISYKDYIRPFKYLFK